MCWILLLLAAISLLPIPRTQPEMMHAEMARRFEYVLALPGSERQTVTPEGTLPSARYVELRTQALANSRLITGPRLKNPGVASAGLDRTLITTVAQQRAYRLDRSGFTSRPTSSTGLRSLGLPTLLASPVSPESSHRAKWAFECESTYSRSLCPSPAIPAVTGRYESPAFTPVEPDNYYRIIGCSFGSTPGFVHLQPSPNPGHNRQPISHGNWETRSISRGLIVEWADKARSSPIPPVFNFSFSSSRYATTIWVIGPVGTQPLQNSQNANQL